jgi:hypothetical protein
MLMQDQIHPHNQVNFEFLGRLFAPPSMPPKPHGQKRTLLFRNVDERVKAAELAQFLAPFATVLKVTIPAPNDEPLGYAFVEFFTDEDALRVFEHVRDPRCPVMPGVNCRLSVHWPVLFESEQARLPRARVWAGLRSFGRYPVSVVPLLAAFVAVLTIVAAFALAKASGRIPSDLLFVPISFAAIGSPERFVYATGMAVVASLLAAVAVLVDPLFRFVGGELPASHSAYVTGARISAPFAVLGLLLHAMVPLDDAALHLLGATPQLAQLTLQSSVHQGAASLFFMAGMLHIYCVVNVLAACRGVAAITPLFTVAPESYRSKYSCLLVLLLIPLAVVLHPVAVYFLGAPIELSLDQSLLANALSQYMTVGAMLAFFVSYRHELAQLHLAQMLGSRADFDRAMRPPPSLPPQPQSAVGDKKSQ